MGRKAWEKTAKRGGQTGCRAPLSTPPRLSEGDLLYEDETCVAVNKPAGIIVHGDGTGAPTLTELTADLLARQGVSDERLRALQPVQRLDRDTTGIVLFSLCKESQGAFDRMIAERRVNKRYLALVEGSVAWSGRTLSDPIGRDRHDARRMRVSPTGKPAKSRAQVVKRFDSPDGRPVTLLAVHLLTGRKHQIRVHLAHAGYPIVGDALYNPRYAVSQAKASQGHPLMLHAWKLAFEHPVTGAEVRITAEPPALFGLLDNAGVSGASLRAPSLLPPAASRERRDHRP